MKSFKTLIKLQKNYVDEQRQHLARVLDHLESVEGQIKRLQAVKRREQNAAKNYVASMTYGAFLSSIVVKERALETERKRAEAAVKAARERLAELFEEQKRYEIAEEQRIEAELKEERRLERIELDEIGGMRHERQKEG